MAGVFVAFVAFSLLSDSLLAERDTSDTNYNFQRNEVDSSLSLSAKLISTMMTSSRTNPTQNISMTSIKMSSTNIHIPILYNTTTFAISNLTSTVRPSFISVMSPFQIPKTPILFTTNLTTSFDTKIIKTSKSYTIQVNQTRIVSTPYTSDIAYMTVTPQVYSTSLPPTGILSTTKNPKKKNLVILYATIFSVVGFVLVVIIGVVVVGCRRSEIKGAFKFNQQLDHELGTFEDIPRAKVSNSRGNNVVIIDASSSQEYVPNGQVNELDPNGPIADEITESITPEECNKSIENRAYDNTALDPDDENP